MDTYSREMYPQARSFQRELFPQLLRLAHLCPGESLPSLLARLTVLNGYKNLTTIRWLAGVDWYSRRRALATGAEGDMGQGRLMDDPYRPEKPATYDRLSKLTGISPIELYRASVHAFAPIATQAARSITLSNAGVDYVLPLSSTQSTPILHNHRDSYYCPICLQSEPYQRLSWLYKGCAACLEHKVLLVKGCHACGAKVSVLDIVKACCERCAADLSDAPTVDISGDQLGLLSQRIIQAGILGQPMDAKVRVEYGIPDEPLSVLYLFLHGLTINIARKVQKLGKPWTYLHSPDTSLIAHTPCQVEDSKREYILSATSTKALLDWPSGFHVFLDEYRTARSNPRVDSSTVIIADLDHLYTSWLNWHWQESELSFIQRAFDQYLLDRQAQLPSLTNTVRYQKDATFASSVKHVPADIAMEVLGLSREAVDALTRSGWLRNNSVRMRQSRSHILIDREHLQVVADGWQGCMTLSTAASYLGMPKHALLELVNTGFVSAVSGPRIDKCPVWMFHKDEVERCFQKIMGKAIPARSRRVHTLLLARAARLYMPAPAIMSVAESELLQKVADGSLRAYVDTASSDVHRINTLLFMEADIIALRAMRSRKKARSVSC